MFQQTILIGYVGNDPEMRYTPSGIPVTSFSLATSKKWTGQDGQAQEQTIWWRVQCWQKSAETAAKYVVKGKLLMVEGEMSVPNAYIDRDGKPRASLELRANVLKFLGGKESGQPGGVAGGEGETVHEEDIPF